MKLFVRNLPYSLRDEELKEVFESIGDVLSAKVVTDRETGRSRGFGFVEMADASLADKACDELNGREVSGRALVVEKARENSRR